MEEFDPETIVFNASISKPCETEDISNRATDPSNGSSTTQTIPNHSRLTRFRKILGDSVFLPCNTGEKGPRLDGWKDWTPADTHNAENAGRFDRGNIAVLLGERTGIYAFDLDDQTHLEEFLSANPKLRETFTVWGKRGAKLLVMAAQPPFKRKDVKTDCGTVCEVLTSNATIAGTHPEGCEYQDNGKVVHEIDWNEIVWPTGWRLPGSETDNTLDRLKRDYGDPYRTRTDNDGNEFIVGICERFWAAVLREEFNLVWLPDEKSFWRFAPTTGEFAPLSDEEIRELFAKRLMQAAREERLPEIQGLISQRILRGLCDAARGVCASPKFFDDAPEGIHLENEFLCVGERFELEPVRPDHRSRNRIPYPFDQKAECKTFLEFLSQTIQDDDITLLQ